MTEKEVRESLLEAFIIKSTVKQKVYENTAQTFYILKKVLKQLESDYLKKVKNKVPPSVLPVIFSMHSNVFEFDDKHPVWNTPYIKDDPLRSYCGTINIYNFLADSFKYNRPNDLGYLVARIFINNEKHFFVEGKRQADEVVKDFAVDTISPGILRQIIETAIQYCIEFDLLVPLYEQVKIATVDQMNQKMTLSKMVTAKRLGFGFKTDDV